MRFRSLDADGDGTLTLEEMATLLRRGDPDFTDEEIEALFNGADKNGNGVVEFDEFVDFIHSPPASAQPRENARPVSRGSRGSRESRPEPDDEGEEAEEEEPAAPAAASAAAPAARAAPSRSPARVQRPVHPDQQNRVKMECPTCGYKSYPQWMNDRAHCLKCDTVLKTRPGAHGARPNSRSRAFGH